MLGDGFVPGGFRPGDQVRVVLGEAAGLPGEVLSLLQAYVLWQQSGCAAASFDYQPGQVCVAVTILGSRVPLALDAAQLDADPPHFATPG